VHFICIDINMEKKLKRLGFKKLRGTDPGFVMFELTPARLPAPSSKPQATSHKQQAPLTNKNKGLYRKYESKRIR
jgi:hypothetical protein